MKHYKVGVIPVTKDGRVVLITSRGSGDWIFPKGCCERGRSDRAVARDEAYEEAGLFGVMHRGYRDFKISRRKNGKRLRIFRMKVSDVLSRFPESRERRRAIVSIEKAEKMLSKELRVILRMML
ncbi:NUDIX hydrolase [Haloferula chungangensis]|uniref:NUDIX hydrolase n=1 Tax=Haloferula chungangensis TaxID=1048331 RepID=A0ABW2LBA2_9BACT